MTEAVKITKAEDVQNGLLISRNAYLQTDTGKQIRVGGLISPLATIFPSYNDTIEASRLVMDFLPWQATLPFAASLMKPTKISFPEIYRETIERLHRQFDHSIVILPDGKGRTMRFNCFAYGLGVWEHPDFIEKVGDASNSAIISSQIVRATIDDGTLKAVAATEAQTRDVVVYFHKENVTHAARPSVKVGCFAQSGGR